MLTYLFDILEKFYHPPGFGVVRYPEGSDAIGLIMTLMSGGRAGWNRRQDQDTGHSAGPAGCTVHPGPAVGYFEGVNWRTRLG